MKLKKLTLKNFQQIKHLVIDLDGRSAEISGENESGKTTIANAYSWLLTGKAHTNEVAYSPQTTIGNELVHHLEHGVEGVFMADDGVEFTLSRIYREVWRRPRGRAVEELTGGEFLYEIDGVPTKAGDYNAFVTEMFGDDETIQVLSKPDFFAENSKDMHWQKRRNIILKLTEDITDAEVIASNNELAELSTLMLKAGSSDARYTIEELQAIARAERKKSEDERNAIPSRIDEVERMKPARLNHTAIHEINSTIANNRHEATKLREEILELQAQTTDQSKRQEIQEIDLKLSDIRAEIRCDYETAVCKYDEELRIARQAVHYAQEAVEIARNEVDRKAAELESMKSKRQELEDRLQELNAKKYEGDTHCYACGQPLPSDEVALAESKFNAKLANDKESVLEELHAYDDEKIGAVKATVIELAEKLRLARDHHTVTFTELTELQERLKRITPDDPNENPEYIALLERKRVLQDEDNADELENEKKKQIADRQLQIAMYMNEINELNDELKEQEKIERYDERIGELKEQMTEYAKVYEQAEKKLYLAEQFILTKANLLTDKINSFFNPEILQFKLFDVLKNGGIEATCEVLVRSREGNLVEFKSANRAGKVNAGLEIIHVLSRLYGKSLPIFIDNAESVNHLNKGDAQTVTTYVTTKPGLTVKII